MGDSTLSDATLHTLELMRQQGYRIQGPGPVTPGATTPTKDDSNPGPGMHVQIVHGSRMVDGFGITGDQAVQDAITKLDGDSPDAKVHDLR
jgi:hypothetical protein